MVQRRDKHLQSKGVVLKNKCCNDKSSEDTNEGSKDIDESSKDKSLEETDKGSKNKGSEDTDDCWVDEDW